MTLRLVTDPEREQAASLAHRGAANFLAELLIFESGRSPEKRYEAARSLEQIAGLLVDLSAEMVKIAEREEPREPGNL